MTQPLIQVKKLTKHFPIKRGLFGRNMGAIHAVSDLSLDINAGEILALMGESGCGKTTCGLTILRLLEKSSGKVQFNGQDLFALPYSELRRMRSDFQVIFQNNGKGSLENYALEYPLKEWTHIAGSKVNPLDFLLGAKELIKIYRTYN